MCALHSKCPAHLASKRHAAAVQTQRSARMRDVLQRCGAGACWSSCRPAHTGAWHQSRRCTRHSGRQQGPQGRRYRACCVRWLWRFWPPGFTCTSAPCSGTQVAFCVLRKELRICGDREGQCGAASGSRTCLATRHSRAARCVLLTSCLCACPVGAARLPTCYLTGTVAAERAVTRRYDLFNVPLSFADLRSERLARMHQHWPVPADQQADQVHPELTAS